MANMLKTVALGALLLTSHISTAQKAVSEVRLKPVAKNTTELLASALKTNPADVFTPSNTMEVPKASFWQKLAKTSFRAKAIDEKSATVMGDFFSDKPIGPAIDLKIEVPKAFALKYCPPKNDKTGLKKHFSDARSKDIVTVDAAFGIRTDGGEGAADRDPKIIAHIKTETGALFRVNQRHNSDKTPFKLSVVDVLRSRYVTVVKPNPKITNPSVNQDPQIFRTTNLLGLRGTSDINDFNQVSLTVGKLFERGKTPMTAGMLEWKSAFAPNQKAYVVANLTHVPKDMERNQFMVGIGYKM